MSQPHSDDDGGCGSAVAQVTLTTSGASASSSNRVRTGSYGHANHRNRKSWTEAEKRAFWAQKKAEKKQRKKERAAARQAEMKAEWDALTQEERQRRKAAAVAIHEMRRAQEERLAAQCEARLKDPRTPVLVFDLSFAWCMTVPDTKSTVSQIKFSYSTLRNAGFPFRPVITSLTGKEPSDAEHDTETQRPLLAVLDKYEGFAKFPPQITHDEHWSTLFPADRVVFLTADADDVLEDIDDDTVYIVGAFVDHNKHKGLSRATAEHHGVRMARLPIKESIELGNRCLVLTINHVVDALTHYVAARRAAAAADAAVTTPEACRAMWQRAFEATLPVRRTHQDSLGSLKHRREKRLRGSSGGSSSHSHDSASTAEADDDVAQDATE